MVTSPQARAVRSPGQFPESSSFFHWSATSSCAICSCTMAIASSREVKPLVSPASPPASGILRSGRAFCERLNYDLLFKWFLDLPIDAPPSTSRRSPRTGSACSATRSPTASSPPWSARPSSAATSRPSTSPWTAPCSGPELTQEPGAHPGRRGGPNGRRPPRCCTGSPSASGDGPSLPTRPAIPRHRGRMSGDHVVKHDDLVTL